MDLNKIKLYKVFTFIKIETYSNVEITNKNAIVILNTNDKIIIQLLNNRNNIELFYDNFDKNIKDLKYLEIYKTNIDFNNIDTKITDSIDIEIINLNDIPDNYYKFTKSDWESIYNISDSKNSLYNYFIYKLPNLKQNNIIEIFKINEKIKKIIELSNNVQLYENDIIKYDVEYNENKLLNDINKLFINNSIIPIILEDTLNYTDTIANYYEEYQNILKDYQEDKINYNIFREQLYTLKNKTLYKNNENEQLPFESINIENLSNDIHVISLKDYNETLYNDNFKLKKKLGKKFNVIDEIESFDIGRSCSGTSKENKDYNFLSSTEKNTFTKVIKKFTKKELYIKGNNINVIGYYINFNNYNYKLDSYEKEFLSNTDNKIYNPNMHLGVNLLDFYKNKFDNKINNISFAKNDKNYNYNIYLFNNKNNIKNENNNIIPSLYNIFNNESNEINNILNILDLSNILKKYNINFNKLDYNFIFNFDIQNILKLNIENNISKTKLLNKHKNNILNIFKTINYINKNILNFIDKEILYTNIKIENKPNKLTIYIDNQFKNDFIIEHFIKYFKINNTDNNLLENIYNFYINTYIQKQYKYNNFINYKNFVSNNKLINNIVIVINKIYKLEEINYHYNIGNIEFINNLEKSFDKGKLYYKFVKLIDLYSNNTKIKDNYFQSIKKNYKIYDLSVKTNQTIYDIFINNKNINLNNDDLNLEEIKNEINIEYSKKLNDFNEEKEKYKYYLKYCKGFKIVKEYNSLDELNYDNGRVIYIDKKFNYFIKYKEYIDKLRLQKLNNNTIKILFNEKYPFVTNEEYEKIIKKIEKYEKSEIPDKVKIENILVEEMDLALLNPGTIYQRTKDGIWGKIDYIDNVCINELSNLESLSINEILGKLEITENNLNKQLNNKGEKLSNSDSKCIEFNDNCIPKRFYRYFLSIYILKSIIEDIDNYNKYKNDYSKLIRDINKDIKHIFNKENIKFKINYENIKTVINIPNEYQNKLYEFYRKNDLEEKLVYGKQLIQNYGIIKENYIYWKNYPNEILMCKHYLTLMESIGKSNEDKFRINEKLLNEYGSYEGEEQIPCCICGEIIGNDKYSDLEGFSKDDNLLVFREKVNYDTNELEKEEQLEFEGREKELFNILDYLCKEIGLIINNKDVKIIIQKSILFLNNNLLKFNDWVSNIINNESNEFIFSISDSDWDKIKSNIINNYKSGIELFKSLKLDTDIGSILKYYNNKELLKTIDKDNRKKVNKFVKLCKELSLLNLEYKNIYFYVTITILIYYTILISVPQYNINGFYINLEKNNDKLLDFIISKINKNIYKENLEKFNLIINDNLDKLIYSKEEYNKKISYEKNIIKKLDISSKWVNFKPNLYFIKKNVKIDKYLSDNELKKLDSKKIYNFSDIYSTEYLYDLQEKNKKTYEYPGVYYEDIKIIDNLLLETIFKLDNYIYNKDRLVLRFDNNNYKLITHFDYLSNKLSVEDLDIKRNDLINLYYFSKDIIKKRIIKVLYLNNDITYYDNEEFKKEYLISNSNMKTIIDHINNYDRIIKIDIENNEILSNIYKNPFIKNKDYYELLNILNKNREVKNKFTDYKNYRFINYLEEEIEIINNIKNIFKNDEFINNFVNNYESLYNKIINEKSILEIKMKYENDIELLWRNIDNKINEIIENKSLDIIQNISEYNNVDNNIKLLEKLLIKEKYNIRKIENLKEYFREIEIMKMNMNSNVLLIKYIFYLNNIILQIKNSNLDKMINKIGNNKLLSDKYLLNKFSYYYSIFNNKSNDIVYNLELNLNNITNLHSINERFNESNDITLYKLTNSYRISLILKYILVKIIENILDNNNNLEINDLFYNYFDNFDKLYGLTNDNIIDVLDYKKADDNKKREIKYDKLGKDRQKLQQMFRNFNIGEAYENIDKQYNDTNELEFNLKQQYNEEKSNINNEQFLGNTIDESYDQGDGFDDDINIE